MQVSVFRGRSHAQNCAMSRRVVQSRTCSGVMRVSRPRDLVSCCAAPCCIAHMQDSAEACRDEGETMADPVDPTDPHLYLGDGHWRADKERTASHFPKCTCGWVGSGVSARQVAGTTGEREWHDHRQEAIRGSADA